MPEGIHDGVATAAEALLLGRRLAALPRPAAYLPGWESLAAGEYAHAVARLLGLLDHASAALSRAALG